MIIEESITIQADVSKVWDTFTDFSCWGNWCSAVEAMSSDNLSGLKEGIYLSFCIRPFSLPIRIEPVIEEIIPREKISWSGRKYLLSARHEFAFIGLNGNTLLKSTEVFSGPLMGLLSIFVPYGRLHKITKKLLDDIKAEAEIEAI